MALSSSLSHARLQPLASRPRGPPPRTGAHTCRRVSVAPHLKPLTSEFHAWRSQSLCSTRPRRTRQPAEALTQTAGASSASADDSSRSHGLDADEALGSSNSSTPDQEHPSSLWEQQARMFKTARSSEEQVYILHRSAVLLLSSLLMGAASLPAKVEQAGGLPAVISSAVEGLSEEARHTGGLHRLAGGKLSHWGHAVSSSLQEADVKGLALSTLQLLWRITPAPVKWPITAFSGFYAFVILAFGKAVARDLGPLWVLGPLLTSCAIWQVQQIVRVAPILASSSKQLALESVTRSKALLSYAQSGSLIADTSSAASSLKTQAAERVGRVVGLVTSRREALVSYVGEGKLQEESKAALAARAEAAVESAKEWGVQRAEDFNDWFFIFRRRLSKLLAKIF